jgi:hypothetical protein
MNPIMRTTRSSIWLGIAVLLLVSALISTTVEAKSPIRSDFFSFYTSAVGSRLDNLPSHTKHCGVCHYDFNGGGPRNLYGQAVEAAEPGAGSWAAAIAAIDGADSDGDMFTNNQEITDLVTYGNTPTFPGLTPGNVGSTSNVPNVNEILPFLVPSMGGDTEDPVVTLLTPNGGEFLPGGSPYNITWMASDNVGVTRIEIYFWDSVRAEWHHITDGTGNTGSFQWFVHNMPSTQVKVRVEAYDAAGNEGEDISDANFTIQAQTGTTASTTLRDFEQPGTQPFEGGTNEDHTFCSDCHAGYDPSVEPGHSWSGSLMAQASRDPLFLACVAIAEQDAASSGEICLRCHMPFGWLQGRSQPTSGDQLTGSDNDGVSCDLCHRMVDPDYQDGVSPAEDEDILNLLSAHVPTSYGNGQFVQDPAPNRRGPFADVVAPHAFLESPFHQSGDFCGTCHDVSNPVFHRPGATGAQYDVQALDTPADSISSLTLMPLERTYSEWKNSAFPAGVYEPGFAGNKADGIVSTCQDCHMSDVFGKGCNDPLALEREDLPFHDMTGGSVWMPPLIYLLFPGETNSSALNDAAARADTMLKRSALIDLVVESEGDSFRVDVTVTNRTGHKLPTGYPEGRRMFLNITAQDEHGAVVYESGVYDASTGVLTYDEDITVYETKLGISTRLGPALGLVPGESFHFALNDTVIKDNRIPPAGFTNAAFETFGGVPIDPHGPVPRYPDGQNWDVASYSLPPEARHVTARLFYQSTSKEYVTFLRDENTTTTDGDDMYNLWNNNGKCPPVPMIMATLQIVPIGVPDGTQITQLSLRAMTNPFQGQLGLHLELPRPANVTMEVFNVRGRHLVSQEYGILGAGPNRLTWDGRDQAGSDVSSGVYLVRVHVNDEVLNEKVVRWR